MRLIPFLLASAISFTSAETNWTFERQGLTAILSDPGIDVSPLRLSCAQRGYLEISILAGPKAEVTLVGPNKISLTIRGELTPEGRLTSNVFFRSLTVEFLRQEGEIEVLGGRAYKLHLDGARRVLQTLESSCMAVA
jgi:hypothetical protein